MTDRELCLGYILTFPSKTVFLLSADPIGQAPAARIKIWNLENGVYIGSALAGVLSAMLTDASYTLEPPVGWEPGDAFGRGVIL